ncbi:cysteine-rich KTR domain-containing protein [Lachnoclostridium sp. An138]|uniref:cysteine-rich KTR domain-containing protein n=1 Tax=Lachnoclostridium sp. An138 TaxID=1965560 RepID=UPI002FE5C348
MLSVAPFAETRHTTHDKIREDTILKNFLLFCPKCKRACLIDVEQFHMTFIKAPNAQPQSR